MSDIAKEWRLKALTDLWTGSVELQRSDGRLQEQISSDRLISTGLLGSIRWWFEVLTRGLGGAACDPSDDGRCPSQQGQRCVVCEFFGCTGWGRKFRFEVKDGRGAVATSQIKKDTEFTLRFTPLRRIAPEEWALLDLTIRLISDYGALGGKTVLKPSDEAARSGQPHHRDYGIVAVEHPPSIQSRSPAELESYVRNDRWRRPSQKDFAWASLTNFWCVEGKYLARQTATQSTFNQVLGRDERKACSDCKGFHDPPNRCPKMGKPPRRYSEGLVINGGLGQWLAGSRQESKKVFSFREQPRTYGFVHPGVITIDQMKQRLAKVWKNGETGNLILGDVILARLLAKTGAAR